ncbi:hypothetical protein F5J12DRAFT_929940 [Pisolithus orientalis]|uniref:uncharacterized protein n=1 Tax=Pisolithus orientalis TaxID=936130 RepID=UPI00222451FA|nr:uncharacterized protein F5J12DRAFT_929940 [Pisolithus orientalis]KAI5989826.1 hypothetical protein F5J12DRAFT_929940 [Pisolithus orientalis]
MAISASTLIVTYQSTIHSQHEDESASNGRMSGSKLWYQEVIPWDKETRGWHERPRTSEAHLVATETLYKVPIATQRTRSGRVKAKQQNTEEKKNKSTSFEKDMPGRESDLESIWHTGTRTKKCHFGASVPIYACACLRNVNQWQLGIENKKLTYRICIDFVAGKRAEASPLDGDKAITRDSQEYDSQQRFNYEGHENQGSDGPKSGCSASISVSQIFEAHNNAAG